MRTWSTYGRYARVDAIGTCFYLGRPSLGTALAFAVNGSSRIEQTEEGLLEIKQRQAQQERNPL